MTGCTVEGCAAWATSKGYCTKHYSRLQRHGTLAPKRPATRIHQLPPGEDDRRHDLYNLGLNDRQIAEALGVSGGAIYAWRVQRCLPSHRPNASAEDHERWRELWHAGSSDRQIAAIEGVSQATITRWRRIEGMPRNPPQAKRLEEHPSWCGEDAGYKTVHSRLKSQRGKASGYPCIQCGDAAMHWAYDYTCPNERQSEAGPYTTDITRYQPMCRSCHHQFDWDKRRERGLAAPKAGQGQRLGGAS